jgi:hypothetical protein
MTNPEMSIAWKNKRKYPSQGIETMAVSPFAKGRRLMAEVQ